jgi:Curli production assembly/transport component CsgG
MTPKLLLIVSALIAAPVSAQKLGVGGTGVDEASAVPMCERSLGTVALVEEKPAQPQGMENLPPQIRAMMEMAAQQQGGGQRIDPLPLLKLLAARSRCFVVVDRGAGFDALQRERALAAGGSVSGGTAGATLQAAAYMLTAQIVYSDEKSRASGGGIGSLYGGIGFKSKTLEAQTLLSLTSVKTGIQEGVASGSARKKDLSILGGGLLGLGIGALGGGYESTDIGKITSLALLDGFRKLVIDAQKRLSPLPLPVDRSTPGYPCSAAKSGQVCP